MWRPQRRGAIAPHTTAEHRHQLQIESAPTAAKGHSLLQASDRRSQSGSWRPGAGRQDC